MRLPWLRCVHSTPALTTYYIVHGTAGSPDVQAREASSVAPFCAYGESAASCYGDWLTSGRRITPRRRAGELLQRRVSRGGGGGGESPG